MDILLLLAPAGGKGKGAAVRSAFLLSREKKVKRNAVGQAPHCHTCKPTREHCKRLTRAGPSIPTTTVRFIDVYQQRYIYLVGVDPSVVGNVNV
jgi:hypothetical protein